MSWTVKDFVNEGGTNVIHEWLHKLSKGARSRINNRLDLMRKLPQLQMPYARVRVAEGDGLIEIRVKAEKVQHRPLAFYGPYQGDVTLLVGAIEKNDRLMPPDACATALRRKRQAQTDPARFTCDHDSS